MRSDAQKYFQFLLKEANHRLTKENDKFNYLIDNFLNIKEKLEA
jgi:hypothetical protein